MYWICLNCNGKTNSILDHACDIELENNIEELEQRITCGEDSWLPPAV